MRLKKYLLLIHYICVKILLLYKFSFFVNKGEEYSLHIAVDAVERSTNGRAIPKSGTDAVLRGTIKFCIKNRGDQNRDVPPKSGRLACPASLLVLSDTSVCDAPIFELQYHTTQCTALVIHRLKFHKICLKHNLTSLKCSDSNPGLQITTRSFITFCI